MNQEQLKSGVRWVLTTFGGIAAGFFVGKGWFSAEQVSTFLSSEVLIGVVVSIAGGIWGLFTHTQKNAVTVVNAMPEVAGVVTAPTQAGRALAESLPTPTVAVAGTPNAKDIAAK